MRFFVNVCIVVMFAVQPAFAADIPTAKIDPLKGAMSITYKRVGSDVRLKAYIFNPASHRYTDKSPAIVFFFGGGWTGGDPSQFAQQSKYLASRGMVAICVNYRTKKRYGASPFECVEDAKSAVRWVRKNAKELGVDPKRIVAAGGSAGGHLAAATATLAGFDKDDDKRISCVPNALVLFNPVFDNGPKGYGYERVKDRYKEFSPIDNIKKGLPPTLVMLGTKDQLIPVETGQRFKKLAEKVGSRCELKLYEDQTHGFFNGIKNKEMYLKTVYDMDVFLESLGYLKGEPTIKKNHE